MVEYSVNNPNEYYEKDKKKSALYLFCYISFFLYGGWISGWYILLSFIPIYLYRYFHDIDGRYKKRIIKIQIDKQTKTFTLYNAHLDKVVENEKITDFNFLVRGAYYSASAYLENSEGVRYKIEFKINDYRNLVKYIQRFSKL